MKKTVLILSLLAFLLGGWVAALWLLPSAVYKGNCQEIRYGVNEGLELVEQDNGAKGKRYVVEDADGNELFTIPLRGCLLDTRFRNGQLRFREQNSKREGFIDRQGMVVFTEDNKNAVPEANRQQAQMLMNGETEEGTKSAANYQPEEQASRQANAPKAGKTSHLSQVNLKTMAQSNPFYKEASKIMQGKLTETDARRRHTILNYCEHFRRAYTTKDLDFLKQVFSDKALIIVGNVIEDRLEILGIPHHAPSYDGRHLRRHPPAAIQERPLRRRRLSLSALGFPQPVHATHPRAHLATGRNRT